MHWAYARRRRRSICVLMADASNEIPHTGMDGGAAAASTDLHLSPTASFRVGLAAAVASAGCEDERGGVAWRVPRRDACHSGVGAVGCGLFRHVRLAETMSGAMDTDDAGTATTRAGGGGRRCDQLGGARAVRGGKTEFAGGHVPLLATSGVVHSARRGHSRPVSWLGLHVGAGDPVRRARVPAVRSAEGRLGPTQAHAVAPVGVGAVRQCGRWRGRCPHHTLRRGQDAPDDPAGRRAAVSRRAGHHAPRRPGGGRGSAVQRYCAAGAVDIARRCDILRRIRNHQGAHHPARREELVNRAMPRNTPIPKRTFPLSILPYRTGAPRHASAALSDGSARVMRSMASTALRASCCSCASKVRTTRRTRSSSAVSLSAASCSNA
eukprot:ctg_1892.g714